MSPVKYLREASKEALKTDYIYQMGAVLVAGRRVVSRGRNKPTKTHPKSTHPFKTIHAELDAILGVDRKVLVGATIYVCRVRAGGEFGLAKPCEHCERMLRELGVREVVFTTSDPDNPEAYARYEIAS